MRRLVFLLIFYCVVQIGAAQTILTGMVADSATFQPLPYVTVLLKDRSKGTITDAEGNFKIVAAEDDTIVFQYVGYQTLEFTAKGWEANLILLSEKATMLKTITIRDTTSQYSYEDLFSEQIEQWEESREKLPFYYSRRKKQKIRVNRLIEENWRVKTYVEVVVQNENTKKRLMDQYKLTEAQYYDILGGFNATNYRIMYFLTAGELISLLNNYFAAHHDQRK